MFTALWLYVLSLLLSSCTPVAVGSNHTSDAALERSFNQHQGEFEALLAEVQADSRLRTLQPGILLYGNGSASAGEGDFLSRIERLGMPKARWESYQKQLQNLGLTGGVLKADGEVEFRVDPGTIFNGDSYKGYLYTHTRPRGHALESLDQYGTDNYRDRLGYWQVYKPLKGNWYIYLFVNG